jgi:hypothetical protein
MAFCELVFFVKCQYVQQLLSNIKSTVVTSDNLSNEIAFCQFFILYNNMFSCDMFSSNLFQMAFCQKTVQDRTDN